MISIVIPVYNEGENILRLLIEIREKVKIQFEVIIVYDFEEDTTATTIRKNLNNLSDLNIKLVRNDSKNGLSSAIKTGFKKSIGLYVLVLMGDASDNIEDIGRMVGKMSEGYDIVCGSRYIKNGKQIGGSQLKNFLSKTAGKTLYFFSRIPTHDVSNNFKLYRKSLFHAINIESNIGAAIATEVTVKAFKLGYRITEIPTIWEERKFGKSNFKIIKWIPLYLKWYFFCIFARPMNKQSLISLFFIK